MTKNNKGNFFIAPVIDQLFLFVIISIDIINAEIGF